MSQKFYVVWHGRVPGVYDTWATCKAQVEGFENARYKGFKTLDEAMEAYKGRQAPGNVAVTARAGNKLNQGKSKHPLADSLAVDAACSGNPGAMEYRGVHVGSGEVWFHEKFPLGTNNIGEFLAVVHALVEINKRGGNIPVYTDSNNAITWFRNKKCKTRLAENETTGRLFALIRRAEKLLQDNSWQQEVLKWDTPAWGEIPADFGRK